MPKKYGTNTKAAEARERKDAIKYAEKEKKDKETEDALWKDDDKHVMRKQQRKEESDRKRQEQKEKKLALKSAYEEEMNSLKTINNTPFKVTRADIAAHAEKTNKGSKTLENLHIDDKPLEENVNRLHFEEDVARNVDDAIAILSSTDNKTDLHPEKRVKAAFIAFEERNLPKLKADNPNLRLSQLKQMLKKDWMKSEENPLNHR